jgi:tetratricopeptide (TPR) repeat protein
MLTNNVPTSDKDIVVERTPIEIVIINEGGIPLSLLLPSFEDILEMKALECTHFSLKEHAAEAFLKFQQGFKDELESLERKSDRFSNSLTFLNRLAIFAEFSGQREKEAQFLNLAKSLSHDSFFDHRLGDNLIFRNEALEAEKLFASLDLDNDIYANLRLAYFSIQREDFNAASVFVHKALEIDSLDYGARIIEGVLRLIQGDYELAIQSFRAAVEERQGSAALYTNMAVAYLYLQQHNKALNAIKRAVTLEPLNENAVMLYADLAFTEQRNEDSLPCLRYFLEFEQKRPAIWARLARALLCLGKIDEAVAALKRQGSLGDSSAVWNNLGVAYIEQRNYEKAYSALFHALRKEADNRGRDYLLAARNICQLLAIKNEYKELQKFSTAILKENDQDLIKKDRVLSDIVAFNLHSLWRLNNKNEFVILSKNILCGDNVTPRLRAWIVAVLIGYFAMVENGNSEALNLSDHYDYLLGELSKQDTDRKEQLINNMAYAYAESGRLEDAQRYLSYLTTKIHKLPYPTATLGLLNFRKGNFDRGEQLYSEAIHLAHVGSDKVRIRQKLNLELAKIWIDKDLVKSKRFLDRVIDQKEGSMELTIYAKLLKERLLTQSFGS